MCVGLNSAEDVQASPNSLLQTCDCINAILQTSQQASRQPCMRLFTQPQLSHEIPPELCPGVEPEVLYDDLLDVTKLLMQLTHEQQVPQTVCTRLTKSN